MNQLHTDTDGPFYRIISVEYTKDGYCLIGMQETTQRLPQTVNLSNVCCSLRWLKYFHYPDLDTLWQLIKRQPDISSTRRIISGMLIKSLIWRDAWLECEQETKSFVQSIYHDEDW